jgi:hypothetical protein
VEVGEVIDLLLIMLQGVQHIEERRPDGSTRHLRNGVEQRGVLPPPPSEPLIRDIPSSRRRWE